MNTDANPAAEKPDFPDWLSPMLVKELRQGMRSRVFLFSFIASQAAMIFLALIGLLNASTDESNTGITVFYWLIIGVPLAIIMPATGLGAVSSEKMGNTLEPIFLTRLTARRILLGKWVAIVAQTLLLVSAILPYTVLRYYLGKVNLVTELEVLGWVVAGSALLIAIAVGISPAISRVGRILLPVVIFIALFFGSGIFLSSAMGPVVRGGGGPTDWAMYIAAVIEGCLLAAFMIEVGAGKIAPAAENHSTSKRLLGLGAALVGIIYSCLPGAHGWLWTPTVLIVGVVLIGATCEPVCQVPGAYRPFVRWGFAGRAFGRLFYPGWPAGFFFALMLFGVVVFRLDQLVDGPVAISSKPRIAIVEYFAMRHSTGGTYRTITPEELLSLRITEMACLGTALMPMALYHLLRLKKIPPAGFYFSCLGVCSLLSLIGVILTDYGSNRTNPSGIECALACIPPCALWYHGLIDEGDSGARSVVLIGVSVVTILSMLILLVRMWPAWRAISKLEKTAGTLHLPSSLPDAARPSASS